MRPECQRVESAPREQRTPTEKQGLEVTCANADATGHLMADRLWQFFRGHRVTIIYDANALFAHPHANDKVVHESIVGNARPARFADRVNGPVGAETRIDRALPRF